MTQSATNHRTMPRDLDAERGLLCSHLMLPDLLDTTMTFPVELFYHPPHQVVFRTLREMRANNIGIDFITLCSALHKALGGVLSDSEGSDSGEGELKVLEQAGGAPYISELFTIVPTAGNYEYYLQRVHEAWVCRNLIVAGTRIAQRGYEFTSSVQEIEEELGEVEAEIFALRDQRRIDNEIKDSKQIANELINAAEAAHKHRGRCLGIPTGFVDIDRMLGGFMRQELYIIAARPSQGKSALALNMLRHALLGDESFTGVAAGLFSLEMPSVDQAKRLASDTQSVELQKFRDGFFGKDDMQKIGRAANTIAGTGLYIDDTPAISVQRWRVGARRMVSKYGVKIIFVDYLQLMVSHSKRARDNRQAEVAEISAILKQTARELNIPIVALAQLTRDAENRVPNLSHLRESGAIEQDADGVIFIHRKEKGAKDEDGNALEREEALAVIAKQRNGPVGEIELDFVGKFTRFENVTEKRYSNNKEKRQGAGRKPKSQTPDRYMEDAE